MIISVTSVICLWRLLIFHYFNIVILNGKEIIQENEKVFKVGI